ncbi:MAG: chemotaxis protein CheR, partial [Bacteroidia bacterium]|nr:chemotaxis protein CheR [Bacteroidia bacterium]
MLKKKKTGGRTKKVPARKRTSPKKQSKEKHPFPIVAIGASAGGLEAFTSLLENLPANTGMAFIYVQHLNRDHKSLLTPILSKATKMKVQEIDDMELMKPDNLYIIPNNKGIEVTDGHIKLTPRSKGVPVISIDILFTSLAETHKQNVIGVVLSGYAHDGTQGLKAIKEAGGITIAQNDSAQAPGMPESAIESGFVDFVLSPKEIARKLIYFSKGGAMNRFSAQKNNENSIADTDPNLKTIFEILLKEKGVDFSHYKGSSLKRRVKLTMLQSEVPTLKLYVKLLLKKSSEVEVLYKNLLINVTGFFRDGEIFRYLKTNFFPNLLKNKTSGKDLRIWVPACSTGEEAYSIAMLLTELLDSKTKKIPFKIFATDLSEQAIRDARLGEFSKGEMKSVSNERIKRFFTKSGNTYTVAKELRDTCVFAPHNILNDPPFFRIDFVSCRNLMIYFDETAQKKVLAAIHFSLNEGGYLMLGKSETTGIQSQFFNEVSNKFKIYSRKKNSDSRRVPELVPLFSGSTIHKKTIKLPSLTNLTVNPSKIDGIIDSVLLKNYMPACAIINQDMDILQFRGSTSLYLTNPSGKATLNILKMARPEFTYELRNAIHKAIKTNKSVRYADIELDSDIIGNSEISRGQLVTLEVSPLKVDEGSPLLLIVFTPQQQVEKYITSGKV